MTSVGVRPDMGARSAPDWGALRAEFPLLDRVLYLNACSLGPLPRRGAAALREYAELWDRHGTPVWYSHWMPRLDVLRGRLEELLGAAPGTVALSPSTSIALATTVSALLRRTERRRVLVGGLDFPTVAYQFLSRPDVELEIVPSPDGVRVPPEAFAERLGDDVALVATTHLMYTTGWIQDVAAIAEAAHAAGAQCLIDGYQSVGCLPLDVDELGCDVFIGGCLKWLSGGPGTAFIYCRPDLIGELEPVGATGWMATADSHAFDLENFELAPDARRFESGTWPVPSHFAALAALELVLDVGVPAIAERLRAQTTRIIDRAAEAGLEVLTPRDESQRCGVVTLACPDGPGVVRELAERGVIADARPGILRLSPHWSLGEDELERGIDAVLDTMLPRGPAPARFEPYEPPLDRLAAVDGRREVVRYGPDPDQFAELWSPGGDGDAPVAVLLHGGYWRRRWRLDVMNALAADLVARGIAVWNVEYRRVGAPGGGTPGTFDDVAAALAALAERAGAHALDLARTVLVGHSAGGQLALWAASAARETGVAPRLAVSLAGVSDLERAVRLGLSDDAARRLLGDAADDPDELRRRSPQAALPLGCAQLVVHGSEDDSVPLELSEAYAQAAVAAGDDCRLLVLPGVGHFDLVDPATDAWRRVAGAIEEALHG